MASPHPLILGESTNTLKQGHRAGVDTTLRVSHQLQCPLAILRIGRDDVLRVDVGTLTNNGSCARHTTTIPADGATPGERHLFRCIREWIDWFHVLDIDFNIQESSDASHNPGYRVEHLDEEVEEPLNTVSDEVPRRTDDLDDPSEYRLDDFLYTFECWTESQIKGRSPPCRK